MNELNEIKSVKQQIKLLGHMFLDKSKILYSRNLQTKISKRFIYSNKQSEINRATSFDLMNRFILNRINFEMYPHEKEEISKMKENLSEIIMLFMVKFRSLPFRIFLNYYCKYQMTKKEDGLLNQCVAPKNVYCFIRRCLMYVLDYKDKIEKLDTSCLLLG